MIKEARWGEAESSIRSCMHEKFWKRWCSMKIIKFYFAFAILLIAVNPIVCTAESLEIAGFDVRLGTNKSKVFSEFQDYRIQCMDDQTKMPPACDSWLIIRGKTAPYTPLANVSFKGASVSSIIKYFDSSLNDPESIRFFGILHSVLSDMTKGNTKEILIQTKEEQQGGSMSKSIFLIDGKRIVSLRYLDGTGLNMPTQVTLTEELR
jgi:hypothetical protein